MQPYTLELDRRMQQDPGFLPYDFVKKANEWGFYTMWIPRIFGGKGYNLPSLSYFLEETASECLAMANLIGVHYLAVASIFSTWNIKLINRLCQMVRQGEQEGVPCIISTAITEPGAGTDVEEVDLVDKGNTSCHARRVSGGYVLNGSKIFISNGHLSTWHTVIAYADLAKPSENAVVMAVKNGTPGFSFGRKENKAGVKGCPASELIFRECFVSDEWVLWDPGEIARRKKGAKESCQQLLHYTLSSSRAGVAAFGTGAARGAFETALKFALETKVNGKLLVNQQWAQSMLAEMYRNVAVARLCYVESNYANGLYGLFNLLQIKPLYYYFKWVPEKIIDICITPLLKYSVNTWLFRKVYLDRQKPSDYECIGGWGSLAKFTATDMGVTNCHMAVELMGQAGLRQDGKVEKMLRDAKLLQIYEGTNQLNRLNLFQCLVAREFPEINVFEHE
jgi:alkylation response protein AidB-like acyl-CoA dehydrogenase